MVKIQLDDKFFLRDATVFGIVSELTDHRLTFLLNNDMGLKLNRSARDRELKWKHEVYSFSEYTFEHPVMKVFWCLTSNRGTALIEASSENILHSGLSIPLVNDLKTFDYFLWYDEVDNHQVDHTLNAQLRKLPYVRAFQKIDLVKSKNINNLLLEY